MLLLIDKIKPSRNFKFLNIWRVMSRLSNSWQGLNFFQQNLVINRIVNLQTYYSNIQEAFPKKIRYLTQNITDKFSTISIFCPFSFFFLNLSNTTKNKKIVKFFFYWVKFVLHYKQGCHFFLPNFSPCSSHKFI